MVAPKLADRERPDIVLPVRSCPWFHIGIVLEDVAEPVIVIINEGRYESDAEVMLAPLLPPHLGNMHYYVLCNIYISSTAGNKVSG